jgi:NAD(P)-dependent dehydrogenase (short-subunit alcohol dehydrogenase family)
MAVPEGKTKDGFEMQFGVNHISHFYLFQLLKSTLLASSTPAFPSRVVSVSSFGHRGGPVRFDDYNFEKEPYDPFASYGQSKTANVYLANEIERRYGSKGLHATSLHPGGIWTGLQDHLPDMKAMDADPKVKAYMKNTEQGAATTVYAALSEEWKNKGGRYLSDCIEQPPFSHEDIMTIGDDGYAKWAYDAEAEGRLWRDSLKMVGMEDDR